MISNVPAEQATIGAGLLGNPNGVLSLDDNDFTDPRHRVIARTIRALARDRREVDTIQAIAHLGNTGQLDGPSGAGGSGYVANLASMELTPFAGAAMFYAKAVRTATRTRLASNAAAKLASATRSDAAAELLPEIIANHTQALAQLPPDLDPDKPTTPSTIADLFNVEITEDWLIPSLAERGERIVVVGAEGGGKSVLSTQWAIALAGGVHPFTGERACEPQRVLLIDAENSMRQTQRRYRWIGDRFPKAHAGWAKRIQHHLHPEGLDLAKKHRGWLMKAADDCSPGLIVLGPAYKLMAGDPQRDSEVLALFSALDEVRVKHNACLFIETHTGHAKDQQGQRIIRPYGSSVWLRWPEIGIGLSRSEKDQGGKDVTEYAVGHWRGAREERDWPEFLERGMSSQLPWSPVGSDYYTQARRKAIGR